uniref:TLDc domain-containing protein n=1 Tax=Haemonchus placei TaxID=6290 RepID=A0A0N4X0Y3_HAEPC
LSRKTCVGVSICFGKSIFGNSSTGGWGGSGFDAGSVFRIPETLSQKTSFVTEILLTKAVIDHTTVSNSATELYRCGFALRHGRHH